MGAGEFGPFIFAEIAARAHFIVLLSHGTLDRCIDPDDWLRREIEYAVEMKRNIIPVLVEDFRFADGEKFMVSQQLQKLKKFSAQKLIDEFYDAGIEQLIDKLKNSSYVEVQAPPPEQKLHIEAIIKQTLLEPAPTKEELRAEVKSGQANYALALKSFNEALRVAKSLSVRSIESRWLGDLKHSPESAKLRGSRYARLGQFLDQLPEGIEAVTLSFKDIEALIGGKLPQSAYTHRAWWANDSTSHVQSKQWLKVGWRVATADVQAELIIFERTRYIE
jgi:hypothetical protein